MYSRRPFTNEFGGQCSPSFPGCEEKSSVVASRSATTSSPSVGPVDAVILTTLETFVQPGQGTYLLKA